MQKFDNVNLDMTVLEFKKMFLSQNDWASKSLTKFDMSRKEGLWSRKD
jgi:hypothetical protein